MKITYRYHCKNCNRITDIAIGESCQNKLKDGRICGLGLPRMFDEFNAETQRKVKKHTSEPPAIFSGQISYNPNTGFYVGNLNEARASGTVYLSPKNGYFYTYITPSGSGAIATLCIGSPSNKVSVSGYKMPLNSKLHELHGHYDNLNSGDLFVATPKDVTVESPNKNHPSEFHILQSGSLIAAWNMVAKSGFVGTHIVIG